MCHACEITGRDAGSASIGYQSVRFIRPARRRSSKMSIYFDLGLGARLQHGTEFVRLRMRSCGRALLGNGRS